MRAAGVNRAPRISAPRSNAALRGPLLERHVQCEPFAAGGLIWFLEPTAPEAFLAILGPLGCGFTQGAGRPEFLSDGVGRQVLFGEQLNQRGLSWLVLACPGLDG